MRNLTQEKEDKLNSECPFIPKINNNKIKSDKLNLSFKERIKYYNLNFITKKGK